MSQLDIPSAAELKGPSLGRMATAALPGAAAPRGLRIRTGKARAPLKVEPGVCGGLGSLTAGDRPRWNGYRGAGPRRASAPATGRRWVWLVTQPLQRRVTLLFPTLTWPRVDHLASGQWWGARRGGGAVGDPLPSLRSGWLRLSSWPGLPPPESFPTAGEAFPRRGASPLPHH